MEKEDNVYEETTLTEDGAKAQNEGASAVLGKFKDVDALARAYGALEAEFTKRSQRLKELEKLADNLPANSGAAVGAEKLRKHAKAHREATKAFDEFVSTVGNAHADNAGMAGEPDGLDKESESVENPNAAEESAALQTQELCLKKEAKEGGMYALKEENTPAAKLEGKGIAAELKKVPARGAVSILEEENAAASVEEGKGEKAFPAVANYGNTVVSSEELYRQVSRDEGVRLKIIGEYLASIGRNGAPLTASGAGVPITPPLRAKNIADAGAMALQLFKQPYQN